MLVKSGLNDVQTSEYKTTLGKAKSNSGLEVKKESGGQTDKQVNLSSKAIELSKKVDKFGVLNHRQERMLELNDSIENALGLKNGLNKEERELERKLLDRQSKLLGHPIKQLSEHEKRTVKDLYTQIDMIYAKGLVTRQDERKVDGIFQKINGISGYDSSRSAAYDKLTPSQQSEMEKIELELMKLDGIEVVEGDIEATFRNLDEKIKPFTHEQDLIIASSVSEYQSFSINLSLSFSGLSVSGDDITDALFDLFSISTQPLSHFNYTKAKALFSLATDHIGKQPEDSKRLNNEIDRFKDSNLVKEKDTLSSKGFEFLDPKGKITFAASKYELNLASFAR